MKNSIKMPKLDRSVSDEYSTQIELKRISHKVFKFIFVCDIGQSLRQSHTLSSPNSEYSVVHFGRKSTALRE